MSFTLNTKRILLLTFLFGLIILAGCTKGVKVTSLSFEKDSVVMFEGDDLALDVTVEPANATNVVLEWSSSNPSVVSVTQAGLASAVGVGEAVITVKFDGKSATLNIEVKKQGFNVSFDSFGGTEVATQVVEENSKAIKPDNPTKEGHVFVAWFDETMTNQFNFNTPITADITLYAKYNVLNYLVTFNPDNGDVAFSQRVDYGEKLVGVPTITKVGYIFDGWYEGEVKFDLNSPISKNTVLKAEWIAKEDTPYVVKHFVYNELSKEFDLDHTDNLTGTTGATVEVNLRTYPGLMPEEDSYSATILGDGSLVIEVYYVEYSFSLEYKLNGGNFTYETREEMVEDFLADYNAFNNSKYTVTTLPMGAWVNTNFHTFLYTPQYREKWLWIPIYLSVVGSSTNKAACADVVKYDTSSGFTGASANWIYALSYEIRGFIAGRKYTENANWMSSDYSEYDLANGFWPTFVAEHEETLIKGLKEPITLVSEAYRDGYLFDGWYVNADLSGDPVTEIKKDAVVYAKWKINNPVTEIVISNGVSSLEKYDEL